jgi:hypothetical protein
MTNAEHAVYVCQKDLQRELQNLCSYPITGSVDGLAVCVERTKTFLAILEIYMRALRKERDQA